MSCLIDQLNIITCDKPVLLILLRKKGVHIRSLSVVYVLAWVARAADIIPG